MGYVSTSNYNATIAPTSSKTTSNTSDGWQWPVSGRTVTQGFNNYSNTMAGKGRPYHCGMDIVSSNRTITAAASGTVKYKGFSNGNGYHVILMHSINGRTVYTLYSHLENYSACPGVNSTVAKGQTIGRMGSTGNSTGIHLHFGIFGGGYSTDPYGYVANGGSNKMTYKGITYYNPSYVISNGRLP